MSSSSKSGKQKIYEWLTEFNSGNTITRVLDLGVGQGTYKKLFGRPGTPLQNSRWVGLEVWKPFIKKYDLEKKYDILINEDIRHFDYKTLNYVDIAFAGDVLEHMTKEESIVVVDKVLEISPKLIISIPVVYYPQDEYEDNPYEVHVKDDWSDEEMKDTFGKKIKRSYVHKKIGVYVLEND